MADFILFSIGFVEALILKWWWLILPMILFPIAEKLYLFWIRWDVWFEDKEWTMLEVVPPAPIEKPFRAMEDVMTMLWGVIGTNDWKSKYCEGQHPQIPGTWFSLEIASIKGNIHFYLRVPDGFESSAESAVYSHFPEAEIKEAEDYTKKVPDNLPNKRFGFYGEDYQFLEPEKDYLPIKTYSQFFEEHPEVKESKRLDPLNSLLEHMTTIGEDEQLWFQIVCNPVIEGKNYEWEDPAKRKIAELANRPEDKPSESKSITGMVLNELFFGEDSVLKRIFQVLFGLGEEELEEESEEERDFTKEVKTTPREKEKIRLIEEKLSKNVFQVWMRSGYVYRKDKPYSYGNRMIPFSYLGHFQQQDTNAFVFMKETRPKVYYFFRERRMYQRKKRIFKKFLKRLPPKYPNLDPGTFMLSVEELATLFHFPTDATKLPASVPRVSIKKAGPPPSVTLE